MMTEEGSRFNPAQDDKYKWLALISVSVGTFMSTLDASIVNIALPTIAVDLNINLPTAQWILISYLLVVTSLLLTLGRLGDTFGRKRLYMVGVGVFVLGSLVCASAFSAAALIFARAVQGLGAAMIMAISPAILTDAFPAHQRGRALGMIGSVVAVGLTLGPVIGGYIVAFASWRWIFLINLPIGVVGLVFLGLVLRESVLPASRRFDFVGAFLLFFCLVLFLLALTHGEEWGWGSASIVMLFVSSVLFGFLFLYWESRAENPVFHLELLRNRTFVAASTAAWTSFVALFAVALYMSFYLQSILGLAPAETGHILLVFPLAVVLVAPFAGWTSDRVGSRLPSSLGLATVVLGLVLLAGLNLDSTPLDALWRLLIVGIGSGMFQAPNSSAIMGSVPRELLGLASGTVAMMRNFGMVSGVAVIGAVIASAQNRYLSLQPEQADAAFAYGMTWGFGVAAGIAAVGVVITALRRPAAER